MNGAEAAKGFIEALKGQPLSLALVVMNMCLLGYLYYAGVVAHDERKTEMQLLYQNRESMAQLLFKCVPQDQH
jgi:hypothetical protein